MATMKPNIQSRCENYLVRLQKRNSRFKENFTKFLNDEMRKLLVIEVGSSLLSVLSVQQILNALEDNLRKLYGENNSMFLSWGELIADIGDSEILPKFSNLMVLEFGKTAMSPQDISILKKIVERLAVGPKWKKIVLVSNEKGRLNGALQDIQTNVFCFLEEPVDISELTRKCKSFQEAVRQGNLDEVVVFIENGADVNQFIDGCCQRMTALHEAAIKGYTDIASKLLENGARQLQNKGGYTPLHLAASNNHSDVVMLLLKHGADIDAMASYQFTPLRLACINGHKDIVLKLLQQGAQQLPDAFGETPLHVSATQGVSMMLLEYGADVNAAGLLMRTPLHCASKNGYHDIVKTLLAYNANIHAKNADGFTALHYAAHAGHKMVINILFEHGAQVNDTDNYGDTPLHWAAIQGQLEVVKLLVEMRNANFNYKNKDGQTPLNFAKTGGHSEIVAYLESKGGI